ncbi:(R)-mandelonitrile lyase [Notoacmeibacter ruber]|uniref:Cupin domain-containing protein n=1 Tax=Notoacmeibacter ruber TaxID=2670375 RepID=A0A3L7JEU2_9HYPH|nr:cupin domain-containing protein [Notoacmeibacter ruber]RLQ89183.1 cupin domain-containing protein [Notoacmeibacter ruber]
MKRILATTLVMALSAPAAFAQTAEVTSAEQRAGRVGGADTFTGTVYVQPVFDARMGNINAGSVTFMPGARSHWHKHPVGQWLVVTSGTGWYQVRDEEKQVMNVGDVIWFPADVDHWHGATDQHAVTHLAVQEAIDGSAVSWGDPVSDEDYAQ